MLTCKRVTILFVAALGSPFAPGDARAQRTDESTPTRPGTAAVASAPSPLDSVIKTLSWELESREAVDVRVLHKMAATHLEGPIAHDSCVEHYIGTSQHERFYDIIFYKGKGPTFRHTHYCDGRRCATVNYQFDKEAGAFRQSGMIIKRNFFLEEYSDRMDLPHPLQLLYVERVPLNLALPKATVLGQVETMGRPCIQVLFPRVRWSLVQDHVYDLDEATGMPLKVAAYLEPEHRTDQRPVWVWEAESLDEVDGHYIPRKSKQVEFDPETRKVEMNRAFEVESVKFNGDYPKTTFWPEPEPGVPVLDAIKNETRQTPGKPPAPAPAVAPGAPIRATPPADWGRVGSRVAFGSGLVLLMLGGGLWWRRR